MSPSSSRKRKRSMTSRTTSTSPYDGAFEQKLIDQGIYPEGYCPVSGHEPPKPRNLEEIHQMLREPRRSLSPSNFSERQFEDFQRLNRRAKGEAKAIIEVVPLITGTKDQNYEWMADVKLNNLALFDNELSFPKPDRYYGAKPDQINARVRDELGKYIVPCKRTSLPAAPNFFFEGKGGSGSVDVAQRQAMYYGANGARAMYHLRNYRKTEPDTNGDAQTIETIYHSGTGTLQIFATHPVQKPGSNDELMYYMTQLRVYAMTDSSESLRQGVGAYRNAREWTRRKRDELIADANIVAQRIMTDTSLTNTRQTASSNTLARSHLQDSDTSTDELAFERSLAKRRQRRHQGRNYGRPQRTLPRTPAALLRDSIVSDAKQVY